MSQLFILTGNEPLIRRSGVENSSTAGRSLCGVFFFGFFICLFVVLFGVLGRPEVQKISKSLWTSGLPSFRGERRRRRAHRGLQPCATLLELQLITVCRVHKQLAALRSVECPWGKLQGEMRLIQTSEF